MKNNIIIVIFILLIIITGCNNKKNLNANGEVIGVSNKETNDELQVKVIIDQINIRANPDVNSNKIGIVKEGSVFTVLEHQNDGKFIWFKIKTNNDIEGYIASEIDNPYVEFNKDVDLIPPTISSSVETFKVDFRSEILDELKKVISYSDNVDKELTLDYEIDYSSDYGRTYPVKVIVKDASDNEAFLTIMVTFNKEKKMRNGNWLTYDEMLNLQNKAKSLCKNHGLSIWNDGMGCVLTSDVNVLIGNNGVNRIGFWDPMEFCDYDNNLNISYCNDKNSNNVSYDNMTDKFKKLEAKWLPILKDYLTDVEKNTGYSLFELFW